MCGFAHPSGATPLEVAFTCTPSGTPPYSYLWIFGDGYSSMEQNPTHTYTAAGTRVATLYVADSESRAGYWVSPPITSTGVGVLSVVGAASPTTGPAPLTVGFGSYVTGGTGPYSYSWDFGDGGTDSLSYHVARVHDTRDVYCDDYRDRLHVECRDADQPHDQCDR